MRRNDPHGFVTTELWARGLQHHQAGGHFDLWTARNLRGHCTARRTVRTPALGAWVTRIVGGRAGCNSCSPRRGRSAARTCPQTRRRWYSCLGQHAAGAFTCKFAQRIVDGLRLTESDDSGISRHGVSLLSGGSGRHDTRLDTPPSINRRHPDSRLAHPDSAST